MASNMRLLEGALQGKRQENVLEARGRKPYCMVARNLATVLPVVTQDTENSLIPIRVPIRKL